MHDHKVTIKSMVVSHTVVLFSVYYNGQAWFHVAYKKDWSVEVIKKHIDQLVAAYSDKRPS